MNVFIAYMVSIIIGLISGLIVGLLYNMIGWAFLTILMFITWLGVSLIMSKNIRTGNADIGEDIVIFRYILANILAYALMLILVMQSGYPKRIKKLM